MPRVPLSGDALLALALFFAAAFVFSLYGAEGRLNSDDALYVYSGQRFAEGVPPYVSVFQMKGPGAPLLTGVFVSAARAVGVDDLLGARVGFLALSALCAAALVPLGAAAFSSRRAGAFAGLALTCFWGFGRHALSGPRAKTPMVLFETLALWLTATRRWFWAGFFGSLAFLVWQPAAIFPAATAIAALLDGETPRERFHAAGRSLAGAASPVLLVALYFGFAGAFSELLEGVLLFQLEYATRDPISLSDRFAKPLDSLLSGFSHVVVATFLGLAAICAAALAGRGAGAPAWRRDPLCWTLLGLPAAVAWSLYDYQDYPDFYIFLPWIALGLGWLMHAAVAGAERSEGTRAAGALAAALVVAISITATLAYGTSPRGGLHAQRSAVEALEKRFGPDLRVATINLPWVSVLTGSTNPTRYLAVDSGVADLIEAETPGGFERWLDAYDRAELSAIAVGPLQEAEAKRIAGSLREGYRLERIGGLDVLVPVEVVPGGPSAP